MSLRSLRQPPRVRLDAWLDAQGRCCPATAIVWGSGSAHAAGRASALGPIPRRLHYGAPHTGLAPVALCRWRERGLFFSCCKPYGLSGRRRNRGSVWDNEMSERPGQSSTVALSCQGPVAQSPCQALGSDVSLVVGGAQGRGCSQGPEGLSPPRLQVRSPGPCVASSASVAVAKGTSGVFLSWFVRAWGQWFSLDAREWVVNVLDAENCWPCPCVVYFIMLAWRR